jgi:hypothetical protein
VYCLAFCISFNIDYKKGGPCKRFAFFYLLSTVLNHLKFT